MKKITVVLPANTQYPVHTGTCDFLRVKSGPTAGIKIQGAGGQLDLDAEPGDLVRGLRFEELYIANTSASVATLVIVVGLGAEYESASGAESEITTAHTYGAATVGLTAVNIGGSAGQKRITIRAAKTNTADLTIGAVAGTGIYLEPGEPYSCSTSAAISLVSTSAGQSVLYHAEG